MKETKTERLYIRTTKEFKNKIVEAARKENRTVSNYLYYLVEKEINNNEEK